MKSAIIKKASEDEEQKQTTTTNISFIQYFMSIKKKLKTKSKLRQIELKLNKITCYSIEKISDQSTIKLGNNQTKKNQNS